MLAAEYGSVRGGSAAHGSRVQGNLPSAGDAAVQNTAANPARRKLGCFIGTGVKLQRHKKIHPLPSNLILPVCIFKPHFRTAIAASTPHRRFHWFLERYVLHYYESPFAIVTHICLHREFMKYPICFLPSFVISRHISFSELGSLRILRSYSIAIN